MKTSIGYKAFSTLNGAGSYSSSLLRYLQNAKIEVLDVTALDKMERGKSDTIDAENGALSRIRTVTPKTRSGMIEGKSAVKRLLLYDVLNYKCSR